MDAAAFRPPNAYTAISPEIEQYLNSLPPYAGSNPLGDESRKNTDTQYFINIPMRDGFQSETRIHKPPTSSSSPSPVIVLIFGGGFHTGECTQLSPYARVVSKLYNATVVNISYRVAPDYRFPTAPNDVWDGLKWVAENAHTLGADLSAGFIVGGPSSGGNLAAVVAQRALDENLSPALTGVWTFMPLLLEPEIVPAKYQDVFFSREQNADVPGLNKTALENLMAGYAPDIKSSDFSPFNSSSAFKGMPPTFVQVCGLDVVRDDALIYERALREHGVKTKLAVYPGAPHGHITFPNLKSAAKAQFDLVEGFGWLLGKPVSEEQLKNVLATASFVAED
ncbi:AB hydrolase superfamily protein 1 [Colletotrichum chlorophyti]|uniref:AB hydrolase superfamily protein 1 n=1 Tax=Colletotrichum chlorophyti TaxID=708187 RepID=A0A1Q8RV67_9PEZI|nr:AB hydrolase superfamily protein 1 [Colletotrichum chlorophyti]